MEKPFRRDVIRNEVNSLEGRVLTFYLNTDSASEEWKIRLKNGLKRTEEYHRISNPDDAPLLKQIIKNVRVKVRDLQRNLKTDRKSTRLNSSHVAISYAVFCLKKKNNITNT